MGFFTSKAACHAFRKSAARWCRTKRSNKKLSICWSFPEETNAPSRLWECRTRRRVKHSCCSVQSISILPSCAKNFRTQVFQTCGFQKTSNASRQSPSWPRVNSISKNAMNASLKEATQTETTLTRQLRKARSVRSDQERVARSSSFNRHGEILPK